MKIFVILIIALSLLYAGAVSYFYIELSQKYKQLTFSLDETQGLKRKFQEELTRAEELQQSLQKENEQLKKESLTFLAYQKDAGDKRQGLEKIIKQQTKNLTEVKKQLKVTQDELQAQKQENLRLADINTFAGNVMIERQKNEISRLEANLAVTKELMNRQEALLHYNLGVSYTKDKNYELAIDEYEKASGLSPQDADTHYNLAILYENFRKNPQRAVEHYKKYLELKPDAADIDEVKEWIERLMLGEVKIKGSPEAEKAAPGEVAPALKIKEVFLKKVEELPQRK